MGEPANTIPTEMECSHAPRYQVGLCKHLFNVKMNEGQLLKQSPISTAVRLEPVTVVAHHGDTTGEPVLGPFSAAKSTKAIIKEGTTATPDPPVPAKKHPITLGWVVVAVATEDSSKDGYQGSGVAGQKRAREAVVEVCDAEVGQNKKTALSQRQ